MASLAGVDDIEASRLACGLDDAFALVAGRFFRREVRARARACVAGMLSGLERKTGWSLAEHAEECFQAGKNEAALDHYQVRLYRAWYRYVTLAMLALAWLAVTRASLAEDSDDLMTSANEIRRMFTALCGPPHDEQHARHWSRWRHRHQQRARHCHYRRQRLQDR